MLGTLLAKVFGSKNDRELKRMTKVVQQINALETSLESLSLEALGAKRAEFQTRFDAGEPLNQILPDAFAVCREVSRRVLGLRHFDMQLIGGITLH